METIDTEKVREIRKEAADAIRTFCQSLGATAVSISSDGVERIYHAGISLDALSAAVAIKLRGLAAVPAQGTSRKALETLIEFADQMPKRTLHPGAACTVHSFEIEAALIWGLDRAVQDAKAALGAVPAEREPDKEWREAAAKIVYDAFPFQPVMGMPKKPDYTEVGNSFMEVDARRAADKIAALRSPAVTNDPTLPCDVALPNNYFIRKGAKLSTLLHALDRRGMAAVGLLSQPETAGKGFVTYVEYENSLKERAALLAEVEGIRRKTIDECSDALSFRREYLPTLLEQLASAKLTSTNCNPSAFCSECMGKGYVVKDHSQDGTYTVDCPTCTVTPHDRQEG